uniref:Uncharacterized protein n=1 Tax=Tanacetum cinerariifolium TaxID=118510 RepID=A0A6L2K5Z7_TANCI|nr:hypothetical protein [Tanacetum cinerariifolium]
MQTRIQNLTDRCVLTIGPRNELMMHKLLQVLGRQKVRQEATNPWKRSRLWCYTDSYEVLRKDRNKKKLFGMVFDQEVFKKKNPDVHEVDKYHLSKMNNLKLLQLNHVQPNWSYDDFPEELRWLCMHGFPLESIPIELPMKNLVALDLSRSKINVFYKSDSIRQQLNGTTPQLTESDLRDNPSFPSLKILDLSVCEKLSSVCDFLELPALERLMLVDCSRLIEICGTIKDCNRIVFIDISYCYSLKDHKRLCRLRNLAELSLIDLERPTNEEISGMRQGMPELTINYKEVSG